MQRTIAKELKFSGIGLHSGDIVDVVISPSTPNSGIIFRRTDIIGRSRDIAAKFNNVSDIALCTTLNNSDGVSVHTVEHLMSALWACGIDNALITINGSEVPIMDGSAAPFINLISSVGIIKQNLKKRIIKIKEYISVSQGNNYIEAYPDDKLTIDFSIDFAHRVIGKQNYVFTDDVLHGDSVDIKSITFINEISGARTFGFKSDLEKLREAGFARGASLSNSIGLDDEGILNDDGLRFQNEFVRHKILDCIGDLYLAGANIVGKIKAHRSGHMLNNAMLHKLFNLQQNYEIIH